MQLMNIKVADAVESATNPRGKKFEGKEFDDLVASIKEKGVLVPVLARLAPKGQIKGMYEVIAGNRRLRAAQKAGLEVIPAKVVEMNDTEAREAQIVENLQRADIHPLDEGEAYRQLIENSNPRLKIKDIAVRVGKSETYVKHRLFLTSLGKQAAEMYRAGKFTETTAVMVADLSEADQVKVVKEVIDHPYNFESARDMKRFIDEKIREPLKNQPWVGKKEIEEKLGAHLKECKPANAVLFGETKIGTCTDFKCWTARMVEYIELRVKAEGLIKISSEYSGYGLPKDIIPQSNYKSLSSKKKEHCEFAKLGIVAHGDGLCRTIWICIEPKCKTHGTDHSAYKSSPEEMKRRKEEKIKAEKERVKLNTKLDDAISKIGWPLSEKHLDVLLSLALDHAGSNGVRSFCKRHELEVKKKEVNDYSYFDYEGAIKGFIEGMGKAEKLGIAFELLIDTGYGTFRDEYKKL